MAPAPCKVVLLGAAGRVGRLTAPALLARGMTVRALVRDPAGAAALLPPDVELVQGDLQTADVDALLRGADAIVFVAGGAGRAESNPRAVDFEAVQRLSQAAARLGVRLTVLLSSAAVTQPEHPHNCTFDSVLKWKRRGEEALEASGAPYSIVRALGLRDRHGGLSGIRIVRGDRIAFGEDIARADVAMFLAELVRTCLAGSSAPHGPVKFDQVFGTAIEIYNDASLAPWWSSPAAALEAAP